MDRQRFWRAFWLLVLAAILMSIHNLTIATPIILAVNALVYAILLELSCSVGLVEGLVGVLLVSLYGRWLGIMEGFMVPFDMLINAAAVATAFSVRRTKWYVAVPLTLAAFCAAALILTTIAHMSVKDMSIFESIKAAASTQSDSALSLLLGSLLAAAIRYGRAVRR